MRKYSLFLAHLVIVLVLSFPLPTHAQTNEPSSVKEIVGPNTLPGGQEILTSPEAEGFSPGVSSPVPNPNIKIKITGKMEYIIKPGEQYPVSWEIEGLEQGQQVTHTDIHWACLTDMVTPEEINDYKNYPNVTSGLSGAPYKYSDYIYFNEYEVKHPAIMVVVHAIADNQDYTYGPVPVDIIFSSGNEERQ